MGIVGIGEKEKSGRVYVCDGGRPRTGEHQWRHKDSN